MELVIKFDYGWFWSSFVDYLFPVTKLDKKHKKIGRDIKTYWRLRWYQLSAWIFFPITILASFCNSVSMTREKGI